MMCVACEEKRELEAEVERLREENERLRDEISWIRTTRIMNHDGSS